MITPFPTLPLPEGRPTTSEPTAPAAGLPPVPGYEVLEVLGRGGMGVVYRARQISLGRVVALKMILSGEHAGADERARFRLEAEVLARLGHPNIVQIHEAGEHDGRPFFALEYVDGGSLARRLDGKPMPPRDAAGLLEVLARAVHAAHEKGVVHRDLKPANVLLTADGTPKITDFGLARRLEGEGPTLTGAILGTPGYMAPEQASGVTRQPTPAVDVYALGAILYECLTGRPPLVSESAMETVLRTLTEDPIPPRRLQPRVPYDLQTICLKCLQKTPGRRYRTALALADDLARWQAGRPIEARPVGPAERLVKWARRRPTTASLLAASLVAAVALVTGWLWYDARQQEARARQRSADLVDALASSSTTDVPRLVGELEPYSRWAGPSLARLYEESPPDSRARLHAAMALVAGDPEKAAELARWLTRVDQPPAHVAAIRTCLAGHAERVRDELWRRLEDGKARPGERLRAAAGLATLDPDGPRWRKIDPGVVRHFLTQNQLWIGEWVALLRPARGHLLGHLLTLYRSWERILHADALTDILLDYAADRPETLAEMLLDADRRQLARIVPRLSAHRQAILPRLEAELDRGTPPSPAGKPVPAPAGQRLSAAHGLLTDRFAFAQTLPLAEVADLTGTLGEAGYRPVRLRPYPAGATFQAAVLWQRDSQSGRLAVDLSEKDLRDHNERLQKEGFVPVDVAAYPAGPAGQLRYAGVWVQEKGATPHRFILGLSPEQHSKAWNDLRNAGFHPRTLHVALPDGRQRLFSSVWRQGRPGWRIAWNYEENSFRWKHTDKTDRDVCIVLPAVVNQAQAAAAACLAVAPGTGPAGLPWGGLARAGPAGNDLFFVAQYAGVWYGPGSPAVRLLGLGPAEHTRRAAELAREGFLPLALSLASCPRRQTLHTGSLWQPPRSDSGSETRARRLAHAAVMLLHLGRAERVWPLLRHGPDPRVRSMILDRFGLPGAAPEPILQRLEQERDVSIRRALLLMLGGLDHEAMPAGRRDELAGTLRRWYRDDPDPGVHSAINWLLRRWGRAADLDALDRQLAQREPSPGRRWYVTRQGHTLAVVEGPGRVWVGSPGNETGRYSHEVMHLEPLDRTYAIGTREVTNGQFLAYLRGRAIPSGMEYLRGKLLPDRPVTFVSWYDAARYCRWLSEQEGLPESEMCYPPMDQIRSGMRLPHDYLSRTGYRLPTEVEWEYACRAGTWTVRPFAQEVDVLNQYAWHSGNARSVMQRVGGLLPSELGLFDILGNASEWTDAVLVQGGEDAWHNYLRKLGPRVILDQDFLGVRSGSSYASTYETPNRLRSAAVVPLSPAANWRDVGFRIARTLRPAQAPTASRQ